MVRKSVILAACVVASALVATAQAENFFVGLLQGTNWQPPKCSAPEVLTQLKDKRGNIVFRCKKPATR